MYTISSSSLGLFSVPKNAKTPDLLNTVGLAALPPIANTADTKDLDTHRFHYHANSSLRHLLDVLLAAIICTSDCLRQVKPLFKMVLHCAFLARKISRGYRFPVRSVGSEGFSVVGTSIALRRCATALEERFVRW